MEQLYEIKKAQLEIAQYTISAVIHKPAEYTYCIIIANGAGANMHSAFISNYHRRLAEENYMTVKFNFHYQEIGKKIPDSNQKCQDTYLGLISYLVAKENLNIENIIPGGKSMGGRIATQIASRIKSQKLIIFGYPLHPPGKPDKLRDAHLYDLTQKVLIFQGERDVFGNKEELAPVAAKMKNCLVKFIPGGDHSLKAPKKSGYGTQDVEGMIIREIRNFTSF